MTEPLFLEIESPQGDAGYYVQSLWFARSTTDGEIWLPSDAGSGIVFLKRGNAKIDGKPIMQPYDIQKHSLQSKKFTYSNEMILFGIRFQPAGYSQLEALNHPLTQIDNLSCISKQVTQCNNLLDFKKALAPYFDFTFSRDHIADFTHAFIQRLAERQTLMDALDETPLSQRQLERHIKQQCGITPKHLARIYRVRQAMTAIKMDTSKSMTQIALECGYCDQSHFTREFRGIMRITPAKYRLCLVSRC